jgi:phosphoribosylformylglycinamidine (FGAM) synthase-like amidotransferase family enzyme
MKATLEFSLPEERVEHLQAVHAPEVWALLHDLDEHLRAVIKHGEGNYKTVNELAIHLRSEICEVLQHIDT